jgi:hypothetical protein
VANIFVSYALKDRDWAFWIGWELHRLGHVAHIDAWEIKPGDDFIAWEKQTFAKADHVLLVISLNSLHTQYVGSARRVAQLAVESSRANFVLPVRVEDCELPSSLASERYCDLFGIGEREAHDRLADFLRPIERSPNLGSSPTRPNRATHEPVAFPGQLADRDFASPKSSIEDATLQDDSHAIKAEASTATVPTPPPMIEAGNPTIRKLETAPFYSDHAARRDLLNRKAVAETVATMIENVWDDDAKEENIDRTFIVHLHGRWGSGKTSILNFLKEALLSRNSERTLSKGRLAKSSSGPSWIIIDYNAWRNQALGPAWWTLMETVYRQARQQLGGWLKWDGIRLILWDRWWRIRSSYAPYALAAALAVTFGLLLIWIWQTYLFGQGKPWFIDGLKLIASVVGLIVTVFAFGHSYPIGSARTAKSYLELSRDPLNPLIKRYGDLVEDIDRPVAVFIDDLDRCNAPFVVELLQTIQTLFRHARVLYVVAADRDWVCASYQQMYERFNEKIGEPGKSLGHLFVEKVFQLSVEVPRLSEMERNQYWDELIKSKLASEPEIDKSVVDDAVREIEHAETESKIIEVVERYRDNPNVAEIIAARAFRQMQSAPLQKEREHFLSAYAALIEPNPRAMKRLLNAYGFRRGFDIQSRHRSDPDALVRWTILENRWPVLADYLEGRTSGNEIITALTKDEAVLEVAKGLTWEKLRPVASAPDQPPTPEITPGAATTKA